MDEWWTSKRQLNNRNTNVRINTKRKKPLTEKLLTSTIILFVLYFLAFFRTSYKMFIIFTFLYLCYSLCFLILVKNKEYKLIPLLFFAFSLYVSLDELMDLPSYFKNDFRTVIGTPDYIETYYKNPITYLGINDVELQASYPWNRKLNKHDVFKIKYLPNSGYILDVKVVKY